MGCCGDILPSDSFRTIHLCRCTWKSRWGNETARHAWSPLQKCGKLWRLQPPCGGYSQWYTLQLTSPVNRTGTWGWFNRELPMQHAMSFLSRGNKHWWDGLDGIWRQNISWRREKNLGLACLWVFPVFMKTFFCLYAEGPFLLSWDVYSLITAHFTPSFPHNMLGFLGDV